MAVKFGKVLPLLLLLATSMFAIAAANAKAKQTSNRIVVGGSENWRFGFNYTGWAIKNGPFYLSDTLVFKYDPPNETTPPHSVYMLPDFRSFEKCDLKRGRMIGGLNEGAGDGFKYVLKKWKPYYFACGEHGQIHCNLGLMKFAFWPLIRSNTSSEVHSQNN